MLSNFEGMFMKRCLFVGKKYRDKGFLILYVGKCLSFIGKTILITCNEVQQESINPYELCHNLDLYNTSKESQGLELDAYDYVLLDCEQEELRINDGDWVCLITDSHKSRMIDNQKLFQQIELTKATKTILLYQNVHTDSKINEKVLNIYFEQVLETVSKFKYTLYFTEYDQVVHLENEYDNALAIKHLSKGYKKILNHLLTDITLMDSKAIRKVMKQAERSRV